MIIIIIIILFSFDFYNLRMYGSDTDHVYYFLTNNHFVKLRTKYDLWITLDCLP